MKQRFQKYFNIAIIMLTLVGILVVPLNVYATGTTPIPGVQAEEDRAAEQESIRKERELTREEGVVSGKKLVVEQEKTVAEILASGVSSEEQKADAIGRICQKDYQTSGILASVSAAQCILESGWLGTSLAVEANNCFGMKATLSGNTWPGSSWTGEIYTKQTWEEYSGDAVTIMADFRAYPSIEKSLADHSAYLLGAESDAGMRYAGLQGETNYRTAIQIIKNGGYATDSRYVDKVCSIIERYNLTKYDVVDPILLASQKPLKLFRVRKTWDDVKSQLGAFATLDNAKKSCRAGYKVFDPDGKVVFEK